MSEDMDKEERDALVMRLKGKPWYWPERSIAQALGIGKSTVGDIIRRHKPKDKAA